MTFFLSLSQPADCPLSYICTTFAKPRVNINIFGPVPGRVSTIWTSRFLSLWRTFDTIIIITIILSSVLFLEKDYSYKLLARRR